MRKIVHFLIIFSIISCNSSQEREGAAKFYSNDFSIEATSPEILQLMINEYKLTEPEITNNLAKQILKNVGIKKFDGASLEKYTNHYRNALYEANNYSCKDAAFYNSVSNDLAKMNVPVFSNFSSTKLSQEISNLLPLVIEKAFRQSIDSIARDVMVEEIASEVNTYIEERISLLHTKGVDLLDKKKSDFDAEFKSSLGKIKAIETDSVFGVLLPSLAFKHIKRTKINYKYTQLTQAEFDSKVKLLNAKTIRLTKRTGDLVRNQIKEIDSSLTLLAKNEEKAIEYSKNLYNKARLMNDSADSLKIELDKELQITKTGENVLRIQHEYSKYSKAAYILTNIVSDYQKGKLDSGVLLNSIDNKYINSVITIDGAYSDVKKSIKDLAEVNLYTISTVSMRVCSNMEVAATELESLKILKGKDAKNVGKFIKYLSSSIQIGTGVGKTFGGDPSGIFNIISGLSGLFRSSSAPSPEAQMMSYMANRFDHVDEKLDTINHRLNTLTLLTINLYKDVITNFEIVQNELAKVREDLMDIQEFAKMEANKEYFRCLEENIEDTIIITRYSQLISNYKHMGICLKGLDIFSNPNAKDFFKARFSREKNEDLETFEDSVYQPVLAYINSKYVSDNAKALMVNSSLFPSFEFGKLKPVEFVASYYLLRGIRTDFNNLDAIKDKNGYINYKFLSSFTEIYLKYSNYFEIQMEDQNHEPYPINKYLESSKEDKMRFQNISRGRLQNLLDLSRNSLIQQSLLSGNELVYSILSTLTTADTDINKINAINCLKYNPILSQNYSKHLLRNRVFFAYTDSTLFDSYSSIFNYQLQDSTDKVITAIGEFNKVLTRLGNNKYLLLDYDKTENMIILRLKTPGITGFAIVNAPFPEDLIDTKFTQNEGVYKMLDIQDKLRLKLFNSYFNSSLAKNSDPESEQVFKALYTIDVIQGGSSPRRNNSKIQ
ncbi:hypothetical protein ACH3O9_00910 [Leeuwenhoekiella sp. A16]|uniref:hypothetical protein n=1 Tax=Leeuwenhoekiella sp. A16 TaxID=3141462 RepID=UPI003A80CA30